MRLHINTLASITRMHYTNATKQNTRVAVAQLNLCIFTRRDTGRDTMTRQPLAMPCTRPPEFDEYCKNEIGSQAEYSPIALSERWLQITFQVSALLLTFMCLMHINTVKYITCQTKGISPTSGDIVYKRIQGGVQADISLRVKSNFEWNRLTLTLHRRKSQKRLRFRVEIDHRSQEWSEDCDACIVRSWKHKQYTSVRAQFCKEYYGQQLHFRARAEHLVTETHTPIVITKGNCDISC